MKEPTLESIFQGHRGRVHKLTIAPNMRSIVSAGEDNKFTIWNTTGYARPMDISNVHTRDVTNVQFNNSGELLASTSVDRTVRIWKLGGRGKSVTIKGHSAGVRAVGFSNNSKRLVTGGDDKLIKLWSLPSRKFIKTLKGHNNWVRCTRFNPMDNTKLISGGDDSLAILWDVEKYTQIFQFCDHYGAVNDIHFSKDGNKIASGGGDGKVKMWDTRTQNLCQHYDAHSQAINGISLHPSEFYLASASADNTCRLWDIRQGKLLYTLHCHKDSCTSCEFFGDGTSLVASSYDGSLSKWYTDAYITPEVPASPERTVPLPLNTPEPTIEQINRAANTAAFQPATIVPTAPIRRELPKVQSKMETALESVLSKLETLNTNISTLTDRMEVTENKVNMILANVPMNGGELQLENGEV